MAYNKIDKKRAKDSYLSCEWSHGYAFMCAHCFALTPAPTCAINGKYGLLESNFKCWDCEKSMLENEGDLWPIKVDEAIAMEIACLNAIGFKTLYCCSGHIGNPYCYVYFRPVWSMGNHKVSKVGDIIMTIESDKRLSHYLKIDTDCDDGCVIIRLNGNKLKTKYLRDPYYHVNLFRGLLKRLILCLKARLNIPEKVFGVRSMII